MEGRGRSHPQADLEGRGPSRPPALVWALPGATSGHDGAWPCRPRASCFLRFSGDFFLAQKVNNFLGYSFKKSLDAWSCDESQLCRGLKIGAPAERLNLRRYGSFWQFRRYRIVGIATMDVAAYLPIPETCRPQVFKHLDVTVHRLLGYLDAEGPIQCSK